MTRYLICITWLVTWQTSSSLLSFSLPFSLHVYIRFVAHPELPWILDLSAYWRFRRVVSLFSIWVSRFVGTISISLLISIFMYCLAIAYGSFILYLCHAYDMLTSLSYTMRGRPFVVVGPWVTSMLLLVIASDLLVVCFLLTHVYHLTTYHATFWQDPLVMSWLTRTISISCYVWLLANITTLSCYLLKPSMIYLTL